MPPYYHKGPKPFALVLLQFNDVPIPHDIPLSRFRDFLTSSGKGGLYDYLRDISHGNITLDHSEVFGWFTMKYSFVKDSRDPFHNGLPPNGPATRTAYIQEAKRLCAENGIDLSRYAGIIACMNANADGGNDGGNGMAMDFGGYWGQSPWKQCNKCQTIAWDGNRTKGKCHDGQPHQLGFGMKYSLSINDPTFPGQGNWRWCKKCESLFWGGPGSAAQSWGNCFSGGVHDPSGSADYRLATSVWSSVPVTGWKHCTKCHQLAWPPENGPCAGTGKHDHAGSSEYTIIQYFDTMHMLVQPHEALHCLGLNHSFKANPDVVYGDWYDVMSAMRIASFDNKTFPPAGVGMNVANMYKLGWVPSSRIRSITPSIVDRRTVNLVALSRPEYPGALMVLYHTPDRVFTVEYREKDGWDRGLGQACVLIHEMRSKYSTGQNGFRWCRRCNVLFGASAAACPSGGLHDHARSGNYQIEGRGTGTLQNDWATCLDCLSVYYTGLAGYCAGRPGKGHRTKPGSDLALRLNDNNASGQKGWKWCRKCSVIAFTDNPGPATCAAGGIHDHSGSGAYTLKSTALTNIERFCYCNKCKGMFNASFGACAASGFHDYLGSGDYGIAKNDPNAQGQPDWKICGRCNALVYSKFTGKCINNTTHDVSSPDVYTMDYSDANGQREWRSCNKCQTLYYLPLNGKCFAGGEHTPTGSFAYNMPNFWDDIVYLVGNELHTGDTFEDVARKVKVSVGAMDPTNHSVSVTIGAGLPFPQIPPFDNIPQGLQGETNQADVNAVTQTEEPSPQEVRITEEEEQNESAGHAIGPGCEERGCPERKLMSDNSQDQGMDLQES